MIRAAIAVLLMFFNLIVYFLFGSLACRIGRKEAPSVTKAVFTGFFLYYLLFALFCIPVMLKWRPLSMLTGIWTPVMFIICLLSAIVCFKCYRAKLPDIGSFLSKNALALTVMIAVTAIEAAVIIYNYQFTLDAAYYVANVTTSLETNTLNIYDPYTGDWQDHFEMRYFFAVFPLNDAVLCDLFDIHPLIWCKTTMAGVAVILTNMVLYMTGRKLFDRDMKKNALFITFASFMNFFFITIFTPADFLVTRTYEGKCLLANVVIPGVFFIYINILEDARRKENWLLLFLVCLSSPVLSSSANMLLPAMIALTILPLCIIKKDLTIVFKSLICMLPGLILMLVYVAYVRGMFVLYTYPR